MRHIGIDVAKQTLAVFISKDEQFEVSNDSAGFNEILLRLKEGDVLGVESTGNYHHLCAYFFLQAGFEVRELNPIVTKQFIRATVRKKKTDKTDAEIITKLLNQEEGHPMTINNLENKFKKLNRLRIKMIQNRSSLKLQLQALEKEVLDNDVAKKSVKKMIKYFDKEIENLGKEIEKMESREIQILESIPGISALFARVIFSEIGDVKRFSNERKIVAFGGYDPKLISSGTSVYRTGKLTKRGSKFLRYILFLVVFANLRSDNVISRYYRKKRAEGKHYYQAMTATSRKLLQIIFALLKKNEFFLDFS